MTLRVLLAAGGTGGHFYPGLAVLDALRARTSVEAHFIGTARGIEARAVPPLGHGLTLLDITPLNGVRGAARVQALVRLPRAAWECARLLTTFRPDVVISVGGYAAGPISAMAVASRVPVMMIEPNVVPGLTHRLVGRFATRAYVAYEETSRYFRRGAVRMFGNPIRRAFLDRAAHASSTPSRARPSLLVLGGSQGARALNRSVPAAVQWAHARGESFAVVHQSGVREQADVAQAYASRDLDATVVPFIDDMAGALAQADLVVCRAGAGTVSEVCVMGRPAVYVPLPTAADDHQRRNAEAMASRGAAVCLEQSNLSDETFGGLIARLLGDSTERAAMGRAALREGHADAAERIAMDLIATLAA